MASLPPLSEDMQIDLDNKLRKYLRLDDETRRKPVIFSTRPEIWTTDQNPHIITAEPLPQIPPAYDSPNSRILQKVVEFYKSTLVEEGIYLTVLVFEFVVDGHVELHIMFSADKLSATLQPSVTFLKKPNQHEVQTYKSTSAREYLITFVQEDHFSTFGLDLGHDYLAKKLMRDSNSKSARPSTSSAPTSLLSLASKCDSAVASRLSEELKRNLDIKLSIFESIGSETDNAAVIFTDCGELWKTDYQDPVIIISEPLPPISTDYDHENFDIKNDVVEYVKHEAARRRCKPFHVSSLRSGEKASSRIHLLFSRHAESAMMYAANLHSYPWNLCPPEVLGSAPTITVEAEYREYSSDAASPEGSFTRTSMLFERRADATSRTTISSETSGSLDDSPDDDGTTSDEDETRPIVLRLGFVLTRNLNRKMDRFVKRAEEEEHASFIFTDDELMWKTNKDPVFVVDLLPPIPSHYDHATFDILGDMVAYKRIIAARNSVEPFYVCTVTMGARNNLQVHILMSQHDENFKTFCKNCKLAETESLPSEAGSEPLTPTTSNLPAVKRKRLDSRSAPDIERSDSLQSIEDLPADDDDAQSEEEAMP